jgi:hypothetical protein
MQAPYFEGVLAFRIESDAAPIELQVAACGWEEGLYISGTGVRYTTADVHPIIGLPHIQDVEHVQGIVATIPGQVGLGETKSVVLKICSLKSALGAAPVELILNPVPPQAKDAGWSVDKHRVNASAGDKSPLTISYTQAAAPSVMSGAAHGCAEYVSVVLSATGTGGMPALPRQGRKYSIIVRAHVVP